MALDHGDILFLAIGCTVLLLLGGGIRILITGNFGSDEEDDIVP